jgi:hypothetical protein
LWAKGLNVNDTYKEIVPVYGWKYLSRKAVHKWVDNLSQERSEVAMMPDQIALLRLRQKQRLLMLRVSTH